MRTPLLVWHAIVLQEQSKLVSGMAFAAAARSQEAHGAEDEYEEYEPPELAPSSIANSSRKILVRVHARGLY